MNRAALLEQHRFIGRVAKQDMAEATCSCPALPARKNHAFLDQSLHGLAEGGLRQFRYSGQKITAKFPTDRRRNLRNEFLVAQPIQSCHQEVNQPFRKSSAELRHVAKGFCKFLDK